MIGRSTAVPVHCKLVVVDAADGSIGALVGVVVYNL